MAFNGISLYGLPPAFTPPEPEPEPDVIRVFPGFVFQLASSVRDSTAQRNQLLTDINAIHAAKGFKPAVSINIGWDEIEDTSVPGAYNWTICDLWMNWGVANGIVIYFKFFYRNYNFNTAAGTDSPVVPPYMRKDASYLGVINYFRVNDPLTVGGTGNSSNGEYIGVHKNAVSRNAKLWIPAVCDRLTAVFTAIGVRYNDNVWFGGMWINETSPIQPDTTVTTGMTPNNPISSDAILNAYFQGLWGVVRSVRATSFSKCMIFLSPNGPAFGTVNVFNSSPYNVLNTLTDALCGIGIQDYYAIPPSKGAIDEQYRNLRPLAGQVPMGGLLSGEVSKAKANGTTPPHPLDTTVAYHVTPVVGYEGANYVWLQVNQTIPPPASADPFNYNRYVEQVNYLKTLDMVNRFPQTKRPILLPPA